MKKLIISSIITIFSLFLFFGCDKEPTSAMNEEQLEIAGIEEMMLDNENDFLIDWGVDDLSEDNMYDGFSTFDNSLGKILTPINNVVRFGRKIDRRVPRTLIIRRISPDSVLVTSERILAGKFVIFDKISEGTGTDTVGITRKPLRHSVQRNSIFVRRDASDTEFADARRRFRLAEISLTKGESRPSNTVQLETVIIESDNGFSGKFENPLHTMLEVTDLPTFVKGDSVKITVLVSNSTANPVQLESGATETLLLHYGINRVHRARKRFKFVEVDPVTGFNKYRGAWKVHEPALKRFHAVIDAIDNGTIYDTDEEMYPYNSSTWGLPYRVELQPAVSNQ